MTLNTAQLIVTILTTILTLSQGCPFPPIPLAASFKPVYGEGMEVIRGEFSCQDGFLGVGRSEVSCDSSGAWTDGGFLCTTNVALYKPSLYNSNTSLPGSSLAVDGLTNRSQQHCDTLDSTHRVITIDLGESLSVVAVKVFTHSSGNPVGNIEVGRLLIIEYRILNV